MFKSYIIGFILSILFTLAAYFAVADQWFVSQTLVIVILGLAILQLIVQMVFFLHLGKESAPRWNLAVFLSTVSIILIIVVGSLWIMAHLNYNMTSGEMNTYMLNQEGMQR